MSVLLPKNQLSDLSTEHDCWKRFISITGTSEEVVMFIQETLNRERKPAKDIRRKKKTKAR